MRTLAIGDIHGCSAALDALLQTVSPRPAELIIALGDYVDRGPDSAGVINRLQRLSQTHRLIALRGNHEVMMLQARDDDAKMKEWLDCGGDATLRSYSPFPDTGGFVDVPEDHWRFLEGTQLWHETDSHLFVHAGVYPELPMAEQPEFMLFWETFDSPPPHESKKIVICGHTSQKSGKPRNIGHAICIDTWAHGKTGWLTCLDTSSGQMWQANQEGRVRSAWIDEYLD